MTHSGSDVVDQATLQVPPRLASTRPSPDDDLSWLPGWRIRELIVAHKLSPVEVTDHFLRRVEALNPLLHAFRAVDYDGARRQAKKVEAAVMSGAPLGPLAAIPIAVKELIAVEGMPFWDPFLGERVVAERDALEVERLRAAGAVIVGVTIGGLSAYEFGSSDQQPQNPWDRLRVCGDSSSGSACAQASGMVPMALAADGLGSTRLPAAYCGLVGMLGARGRVAKTDWSQLVNSSLSHSGPLARDVRDAAIMMSVLAGPDGRDLFCLPDDPPAYLEGLDQGAEGMRLVWTDDFGYASTYAQPESQRVIDTVRRAAEELRTLGAEIKQTRRVFDEPFGSASTIMLGDPGLAIYRKLPREDVFAAREARGRIWETFRSVLEGQDFILSPTVQHVAPTRDAWAQLWQVPPDGKLPSHMAVYTAHTAAANLLGWPAISIPAGMVDGMPVGLQILGRPDTEAKMLRLAHAFLALRS
jgi:aspartyl-tRNA(Asn)/glutamyl-tRNA(Gln) amidotransferase subunit A